MLSLLPHFLRFTAIVTNVCTQGYFRWHGSCLSREDFHRHSTLPLSKRTISLFYVLSLRSLHLRNSISVLWPQNPMALPIPLLSTSSNSHCPSPAKYCIPSITMLIITGIRITRSFGQARYSKAPKGTNSQIFLRISLLTPLLVKSLR